MRSLEELQAEFVRWWVNRGRPWLDAYAFPALRAWYESVRAFPYAHLATALTAIIAITIARRFV